MHSVRGAIMELKSLTNSLKRGQTMKVMNLLDDIWDGPTLDSFNLGLINLDYLSRDNITKNDNLRSKELTLFKFSI